MDDSFISVLAEASEQIEARSFEEATRLLEEAIEENSISGRIFGTGQLYSLLSVSLQESGNVGAASAALSSAVALFEDAGDSESLSHAYRRMGEIDVSQSHWATAKEWFLKALSYAEIGNNGPAMVQPLIGLILAARHEQDFMGQRQYIERAVDVNKYTRNLHLADFLGREGMTVARVFALQSEVLRAMQAKKDALARKGNVEEEDQVTLGMASVASLSGDFAEAIRHLTVLEQLRSSRGQDTTQLQRILSDALSAMSLGHRDEARNVIVNFIDANQGMNQALIELNDPREDVSTRLVAEMLYGSSVDDHGKIDRLLSIRDRAVDIGDRIGEARTSVELGKQYLISGNNDAAEGPLERALAIAKEEREIVIQSSAAAALTDVLMARRDFDAIRTLLSEYLALDGSSNDSHGQISAWMGLATADFLEEVGDRGRNSLRNALKISRRLNDGRGEAMSLLRLARLDSEDFSVAAAVKKAKSAIQVSRQLKLDDILAEGLLQLSGLYWQSGNFQTDRLTEEAKNILLSRGQINRYADAWRDASSASQARKDYERAIVEAVEALNASHFGAGSQFEALCLFQIGSILRDQDRRGLALEFMSVAIWLDRQVESELFQLHLEHASTLSSNWGMADDFTEMATTAEQRYGDNRGRSLIERLRP